jgi:hypothetical protein
MNPIAIIEKSPNPTVAESVSELVSEGGNVLPSDDAPIDPRKTALETTLLEDTRRAASQIRVGQSLLMTPHRLLMRASAQPRPTLHLPPRPAMTEENNPGVQPMPSKVSHRPRARLSLFH